MASPGGASGGVLRGHAVAFALVAIFAGVALAVGYAASDGAIFGLNSSSAGGLPGNDSGAGGATVISSDSFDAADAQAAPSEGDAPPESGMTLTEEQRRLLAMRDFPWNSLAGGHVASTQDLMDRSRPVDPGTEPLALSDEVVVNVERDRDRTEEDLELADIIDTDIIDDVIDIEIPIDIDDEEPEEQELPEDGEQEEAQDGDDQGSGSDGGNQTDDNSSGEGSEDEDSDDGQQGSDGGSGGNSTSSGPSENSGDGDGNSTGTEDSSIDG